MISICGPSTNLIYYFGIKKCIDSVAPIIESRVGNVKSIGPVCFELPEDDRLIYLNERYINPFFAIIEASWILSGRNDLAPLEYGIKNYAKYSDDNKTLNGAYGYRLKFGFDVDQLAASIRALSKTPQSRRVILTFYSPYDIESDSKDIPCNTHAYIKIINNRLDITVLNRSNDVFKGIPYNFVVFRAIQKYIASQLSIECGKQRHITDCLHLYEEDFEAARRILETNTPAGILAATNLIQDFEYNEIISNYKEIASLDFSNLVEPYSSMFAEFAKTRSDSTKQISLEISGDFIDNSFTYVAKKWFSRNTNAIGPVDNVNIKNLQETLAMKSSYDEIKALWAFELDDDPERFNALINRATGHFKEIKTIFNTPMTVEVASLSLEKQLAYIILSLALSSIDPYIVSTDFGRNRQAVILAFAEKIGLPRGLCIVSENTVEEITKVIDNC